MPGPRKPSHDTTYLFFASILMHLPVQYRILLARLHDVNGRVARDAVHPDVALKSSNRYYGDSAGCRISLETLIDLDHLPGVDPNAVRPHQGFASGTLLMRSHLHRLFEKAPSSPVARPTGRTCRPHDRSSPRGLEIRALLPPRTPCRLGLGRIDEIRIGPLVSGPRSLQRDSTRDRSATFPGLAAPLWEFVGWRTASIQRGLLPIDRSATNIRYR